MTTQKTYTIAPGSDDQQIVALSQVEGSPSRYLVTLGAGDEQRQVEVDARLLKDEVWSLVVGQRHVYEVHASAREDDWEVELAGARFKHRVLNERQMRRLEASGGAGGANQPELEVPMAGKVIALLVEPGQSVSAGDKVVVVEAMKMENEIKAHRDGVIGQARVQAGDTVEVGAVLLTIEDAPQ
jgi:biotin carboxyl carrier protein